MSNDNEFVEELCKLSNEELIDRFNGDIGSRGWVAARDRFLAAMRDELAVRGFDMSLIVDGDSMSISRKIALTKDNKIVPFGAAHGGAVIRISDTATSEAKSPTSNSESFEINTHEETKKTNIDNKAQESTAVNKNQKNGGWKEDQRRLSTLMQHLNSGGRIEDADDETKAWWINRY